MKLKWIVNINDPASPDALLLADRRPGETPLDAFNRQQAWLQGKIIGLPKASMVRTVDQQIAAGLVGVYEVGE